MSAHSPTELMQRAIRLAMRGRGRVEPNPMVGCVLVKDGRVIGEGWHARFGGPHAEAAALAACAQARGATAYVTLEPCCHADKKTPPCVPALVQAGVARVVAACADPNPQVAGKGFEQLRQAGIAVETGILEKEAQQLNAPFFARVLHRRPYVTLKWAQSADGKVAGPRGRRLQISNSVSMRLVHELRARSDAILVGIHTAVQDDPMLTARDVAESRALRRVVLDSDLRLPLDGRLATTAAEHPVLAYCAQRTRSQRPERAEALERAKVQVVAVPERETGQLDLCAVLEDLGRRDVTHLLVEPGPAVARSFLAEALADRLWVFRSPMSVDAEDAPDAPVVTYPTSGTRNLAGDTCSELLNPASPVFFALIPSPDLGAGDVLP